MTGCLKRLAHDAIGNEDPSFRVKTLGQTQQAHPCACAIFGSGGKRARAAASLVIARRRRRAVVLALSLDVKLRALGC